MSGTTQLSLTLSLYHSHCQEVAQEICQTRLEVTKHSQCFSVSDVICHPPPAPSPCDSGSRRVCKTVTEKQCHTMSVGFINHQTITMIDFSYKAQCQTVSERVCPGGDSSGHHQAECHYEPRQQCVQLPVEQCREEPSQVCHHAPEPSCEGGEGTLIITRPCQYHRVLALLITYRSHGIIKRTLSSLRRNRDPSVSQFSLRNV